ncbi:anhydro-N-acetylmuramic acid kinase [Gracilibacillus alcaliphilus]|uniref:anhydro-N-acetylmuramic acid kinase n=1 Tax=Gracilibacillus alcaliphilus TaxID=1401441 RepID=UPI0019592300|nr:anhydro-N-acetylmuramic acid kinase [Gracilibacillus alcaliphilus]MBM7676994.1 anhydro-N-acetylmuramic acid kinase [Gracilibacillus alcaliphilus]
MTNHVSYAIGLMSGTSLDGIDAALIKVTDHAGQLQVVQLGYLSIDYTAEMQEELFLLCQPETATVERISRMNMYLGELFAEAAIQLIQSVAMKREEIALIGSHGQTIYHEPVVEEDGAVYQVPSTLQIGDISVIAERTGITTVGDFRTRDMAAGGQGAPLVPYVDYLLYASKEVTKVLLNIGGIANITLLPKGGAEDQVLAYDTGPGNMLIDAFVKRLTEYTQTYDKDGQLAAKGQINYPWLSKLLQHSYFQQSIPKTTGREMFGEAYAERLWNDGKQQGIKEADRLMTITELTAVTIMKAIQSHGEIDEIIVSGGGAHNQTLMKRLVYHAEGTQLQPAYDEQVNPDSKEAVAFAVLGYQCLQQRHNTIPGATGANHAVVMGKVAW